jgi:hypothetical protein
VLVVPSVSGMRVRRSASVRAVRIMPGDLLSCARTGLSMPGVVVMPGVCVIFRGATPVHQLGVANRLGRLELRMLRISWLRGRFGRGLVRVVLVVLVVPVTLVVPGVIGASPSAGSVGGVRVFVVRSHCQSSSSCE